MCIWLRGQGEQRVTPPAVKGAVPVLQRPALASNHDQTVDPLGAAKKTKQLAHKGIAFTAKESKARIS